MNLLKLKDQINKNPKLKARIHRMMFSNVRPRFWVKCFLNPIFLHHGKGAVIRRKSVISVSPINRFRVGSHSTIEEFCVVDNGVGNVIIGNHTRIGLRNTIIGPVTIGNNVILAQNVVLSGLNHIYENVDIPIYQQGVKVRPITVEDDAWIAANSIVTAGVTIGKHAVVAGGSVVTKDVAPYTVVAGNPAVPIKKYDFTEKKWMKI